MAKKAYIGVKSFTPRGLPNGYTQVEYIESSGAQYIDTGFKPNQDTRIVVDFQMTAENDALAANDIFGARNSASSKAFAVQWNIANNQFQHFYNNGYDNLDFGDLDIRQVVEMNKNVFTLNGVTHTRTYASFQCDYTLYIFAVNNAGSAQFYSKMRLYSCQIYDNGTLVRDFVPCFNTNGEMGLYDLSEEVFYQNAGTGSFSTNRFAFRELPEGYTQVEYIQSNGTECIDTGFKPNNNTRVVMDFQFSSAPVDHSAIFGARDSASANFFMVLYNITNSYFRSYYNTTYSQTWPIDSTAKYTIDKNKETTTLGDTSQSYTAAEFQCSYNMYLFAANSGGASTFPSSGLMVYSCQIYDNGTLIRDYVPCTNADGIAGLYDMVNGVFYVNAGTGSFNVGETLRSVARKVKGIYIGINGVARKVKKAYIGDENGVARLCYLRGTPVNTLAVGSSVFINVDGVRTEFLVIHQGNPDSTVYDWSCSGTWLLSKETYGPIVWDGTDNDYANSNIHSYLNQTFLNLLDSGIQNLIKQAKIPYTNGTGSGGSLATGSSGLSTKIFLLSLAEVNHPNSRANVEGAALDYFVEADEDNYARLDSLVKYDTELEWAFRSPGNDSTTAMFAYLYNMGFGYTSCLYSFKFSPALILPSDAQIDENFNVIA